MRRVLLTLVLLVACSSPVASSATRVEPLPQYAQWWTEVQMCSGKDGVFPLIRWWSMPGSQWVDEERGRPVVGWASGNDIIIAEAFLSTGWVVKHEMLHVLGFRHPGHTGGEYPWPFVGCVEV